MINSASIDSLFAVQIKVPSYLIVHIGWGSSCKSDFSTSQICNRSERHLPLLSWLQSDTLKCHRKPEVINSMRKYRVRVLVRAPSNYALDEIVFFALSCIYGLPATTKILNLARHSDMFACACRRRILTSRKNLRLVYSDRADDVANHVAGKKYDAKCVANIVAKGHFSCSVSVVYIEAKKPATERASPTTPLSYSSGEGGVDDVARSKVIGRNETTPTKRPRKKKTLAELKEDETALLKERKQLKRQVANLQAACEKRRKENESLNKMKNDMQPHKQGLATSEVNNHMEEKEDSGFVLPDLNIPAGEDE
ncbi:hypothetical protein CTI12_AA129080 [Artemisia annua]|uniref:Uncharacterized protein n=1 Tax=Artemisia annua TaxID=35608 RepID=A0A2U1PNQ9_ARTAN|nr:hypothetical protein CTI12_AA129080 [Artemisia annua]